MRHDDQFVSHKRGIVKRALVRRSFDQAEGDLSLPQGLFDIAAVPVQQRDFYLRELLDKRGEDRRQHILGNRRTCPQPQFPGKIIRQQVHLEIHLPVCSQQLFRMRQQQFTRMGQSDMASHPIEQRCFILHLQFMNMLADGWLTDKQLF